MSFVVEARERANQAVDSVLVDGVRGLELRQTEEQTPFIKQVKCLCILFHLFSSSAFFHLQIPFVPSPSFLVIRGEIYCDR